MKITKYILILPFSILISISILFSASKVQASEATLEFKHVSFDEENITTNIYINTYGSNINGVTADFSYSSDILEVTEVSTEDSVFDNFVENDYSQSGIVYLSCYSIEGYTGEGLLAEVSFKAIGSGSATLTFTDDVVVLESDTSNDILATPESQIYTVSEDLITLPETGTESEVLAISGIVFFIAIVMIVIFALAGFTMWGGIYFSLGKWEVSSEASVGVGDKKKKKLITLKKHQKKAKPKNKPAPKKKSKKKK